MTDSYNEILLETIEMNNAIYFDLLELSVTNEGVQDKLDGIKSKIVQMVRKIVDKIIYLLDKFITSAQNLMAKFKNFKMSKKVKETDLDYFKKHRDFFMSTIKGTIKPDWYKIYKLDNLTTTVFDKLEDIDVKNTNTAYVKVLKSCIGYDVHNVSKDKLKETLVKQLSFSGTSLPDVDKYIKDLNKSYESDLTDLIRKANLLKIDIKKRYKSDLRNIKDGYNIEIKKGEDKNVQDSLNTFKNKKMEYITLRYTVALDFVFAFIYVWRIFNNDIVEIIKKINNRVKKENKNGK